MKAFIDRIEGNKAVLLLGDDETVHVSVPISWLPAGSKEGTVLTMDFTIDEKASNEAKNSVKKLMDSLGDEP